MFVWFLFFTFMRQKKKKKKKNWLVKVTVAGGFLNPPATVAGGQKVNFRPWLLLIIIIIIIIIIIRNSKMWVSVRFKYFWKKSFTHQTCIYLIKNTVNTEILWNIITILNNSFLFEYIVKLYLFLWFQSCIFSIITPVFSVTWSFRNQSNMLKISDYQYSKQINILWKPWYIFVHDSLMNRRSKEQHLFEI